MGPDIDNAISLYAHPVQRGSMCDWRDNQPTAVLEADETSIEQVIDARRQQQAVLAVQAFLVARISPRFAVACPQMGGIIKKGDSASMFNPHDPLLEQSLTLPSNDQLLPFSFRYSLVALDLRFEMVLPEFNVRIYSLHGEFRIGLTRPRPDRFRFRASPINTSVKAAGTWVR